MGRNVKCRYKDDFQSLGSSAGPSFSDIVPRIRVSALGQESVRRDDGKVLESDLEAAVGSLDRSFIEAKSKEPEPDLEPDLEPELEESIYLSLRS